jgi:hypothetical protein
LPGVSGIDACYVLFNDVTNWDGGNYTGLSEIRFFGVGPVDLMTPAHAEASSEFPACPAANIINGSGLTGIAHSTDYRDMWLSNGVASPTLKLDLGQSYSLTRMQVWNYNQVTGSALTGRGFKTADVYVSTSGTGDPTSNPGDWTLLIDDQAFVQATGAADYVGTSYVLSAGGVTARWMFFGDVTNWDGGIYTGLSEIRFLATN